MRERSDLRLHLALIFVQVTFGALHVFGKAILQYIPPLAVASSRILVSAPLLLVLALRVERRIPSAPDLARLAGLGFLGVFCNQIFYILGLQRTTAINAGILMLSIPVFVALIAALGGLERLTGRKAAGVSLAVAGAFAMMDWGQASFAGGTMTGNALLLLNCLAYAFYLVLQRPLLERLHPLTVVAWAFVFGGVMVLAVSLPAFLQTEVRAVPGAAWAGLAFVAVIPSGVNYALNTWALRRSSASLVGTYTTLQPVAAALLAASFLHEAASWREAAGFVLITGGLWLVSGERELRD